MALIPRFSVKQIDKGWNALREVAKTIKQSQDYVRVGVLGDSKKNARRGEPIDNITLALIHEFGTATIPERSFIRSTFETKKQEYIALMRRMVPLIYAQKMTVPRMLGVLGAQMAADMKARIHAGIPPPLAPSTIARKGSTLPLVDTGQLINAITWQVISYNTPQPGAASAASGGAEIALGTAGGAAVGAFRGGR